jgi:spoIIIJ-associated protein
LSAPGDRPADRVRDLLQRVAEALALPASVSIEEDGRTIRGTLEGENLGLFIGRRGQTIDAVQHLAYKVATREVPPSAGVRVVVDAAGYRARREQALHRQADQAATQAVRTGRPVALDAMSATERKVVHERLKDRDDVETYSEGTEPDRHLVVAPLGA